MYGYIYITENLINHKRYIGQHKSIEFDPEYKGSGTLLFRAFDKYGWDNFKTEVLEWCQSKEELDVQEVFWIIAFNAVEDRNFYNIAAGGTGGTTLVGFTDEERAAHAEHTRIATKKLWQDPEYVKRVMDGRREYWKDPNHRAEASLRISKVWSNPEYQKRMSEIHQVVQQREDLKEIHRQRWIGEKNPKYGRNKGKDNPMYGHIWTPEQLELQRQSHLGQVVSEETKRKTSESIKKLWTDEKRKEASVKMLGGKNRAARKVVCVETGEVFDTIWDAGVAFGYKNPYIISDGCKERCAIRGHHWMYYEDWIKLQNQGDAS